MTVYLDTSNCFHQDGAIRTMECPHCNTVAHMTLVAAPDFRTLHELHPAETGIVLRCDACEAPVFLRYRIKAWRPDRIEFHAWPQEVERPREQFSFSYLPETVATAFREALGCYSYGLFGAFAAMCRLTARAVLADQGDARRLKLYDLVEEVRELAELDEAHFSPVREIIFGDRDEHLPGLDRATAAVLLETMKDLLHQCYVRGGRLKKALRMRKLFAGQEDADSPDGGPRPVSQTN